MTYNRGVTLVEVIVVSVIVGILACIAIPSYQGYVKGARLNAARSTCELTAAAIASVHSRGQNISANSWGTLGIANPSDETWAYSFPTLNANTPIWSTYRITVNGRAGSQFEGNYGRYSLRPNAGNNNWVFN